MSGRLLPGRRQSRQPPPDNLLHMVSGRDVEYQELTLQFNDLVLELVERKNSEDIHKAELPKFLFRVVDFIWITSPRSPRQM